ncbi:MAG: hypothetical protein AAGI48_16735 [Verrucomicrobiota bacterium]
MKRLLTLLTACFLPAQAAEEEQKEVDFVRVTEDGEETRLETAITRFEKDGVSVDLIGAIHIADAAYYDGLEERFEDYEALLYEGVGNPFPKNPPVIEGPEEPEDVVIEEFAKPSRNLDGLSSIYQKGADWLGLSYQMQEIDYGKANFVHADLNFAEFRELQAERKESILGFAIKASFNSEVKHKEPSTFGLVRALVKRDKNLLKLQLVHTLGAGDDQVATLAGDSVIISDRNERCLEVLEEQIAAGKTKLGIFYGAAHFPDMEERLVEDGWKRTREEWVTAWDLEG